MNPIHAELHGMQLYAHPGSNQPLLYIHILYIHILYKLINTLA